MGKWLLIVTGIVSFSFIVLLSILVLKSPGGPSPKGTSGTESSGGSSGSDWIKGKAKVASDCKEVAPTFIESEASVTYMSKLFDAIGGAVLNPEDGSFTGKGDQIVSTLPLAKNGGDVNTKISNCWVVYIGNQQGSGNIAYEASSGEIMKFAVTNFPVPHPPAAPVE